MPNLIDREEILAISDTITDCIVENPEIFDILSDDYENWDNNLEDIDGEYYVKIWFTYIAFGVEQNKGRREFTGSNKEEIISEITAYIREREQLNLDSLSNYKGWYN